MRRRVVVLGSTGSVGRQTLEVLEGLAASHVVVGLAARRSASLLHRQIAAFQPEAACLVEPPPAGFSGLSPSCDLLTGPDGLVELVRRSRPDVVVCGITGAAGLPSTLAAAQSGAVVALANKESLVLAGHLVKEACRSSGSTLVPVDSEHSAIAQCLAGGRLDEVRRVILTASGGPFRRRLAHELIAVSPAQALRHPRWVMGPKISVDSATLMNKALEVLEACHLFDLAPEQVEVVVHPQSVVHSMVEFVDGAILAQLSPPDMRLPIRWALGWPRRLPSGAPPVDLLSLSGLTFEAPDREAFPCLALGERAARLGGAAGCALSAANEVAVDAFLSGRLPFTDIHGLAEEALGRFGARPAPDLPTILAIDAAVRQHVAARLPQPTS